VAKQRPPLAILIGRFRRIFRWQIRR